MGAFLSTMVVLSVAVIIEASDSSTVNHGGSQSITAHSTCRNVTNNSATGLSVYVPTVSSAEWTSFYTNPPGGVGVGTCETCVASWTQTANLPQAKYFFSQSTMLNGNVLACGGLADTGPSFAMTNRCDVFNVSLGTWSQVASLSSILYLQSSVTMNDGRVVLCGGSLAMNSNHTNVCRAYDPVANTWGVFAAMPTVKSGHTAALLGNGNMIACGGYVSTYLNRCDVYSSQTGTWTQAANLPEAKHGLASATLIDGRVLVCGGYTGALSARCDVYNSSTNTWTRVADMPQGRYHFSMSTLQGGRVIACGGNSGSSDTNRCDTYNPATNTWTSSPQLPQIKGAHKQSTLSDGRVLICGGYDGVVRDFTNRCDVSAVGSCP